MKVDVERWDGARCVTQFGAPVVREGGPAVLRDKEAADRAGYVNQYGMSRKVSHLDSWLSGFGLG